MHEILRNLNPGSFVLDLGCGRGSFGADATKATVVRFDRAAPDRSPDALFVQGDARELPFASHTLAAVIANHSLEHIEELGRSLNEIGRAHV